MDNVSIDILLNGVLLMSMAGGVIALLVLLVLILSETQSRQGSKATDILRNRGDGDNVTK
jgi:hypothetical protein